jgi:hypothetical protein
MSIKRFKDFVNEAEQDQELNRILDKNILTLNHLLN